MIGTRLIYFVLAVLSIATPTSYAREEEQSDTLRVLAIGNSFSDDAVEHYLWDLFDAADIHVVIGNLYIPGCPLERHYDNSVSGKREYSYRKTTDGKVWSKDSTDISFGIEDEAWDYVSLQQSSALSGRYESYEPYLGELLKYLKSMTGDKAKFVWHQTWAYAQDSRHDAFPAYGRDQMRMYRAIIEASRKAVASHCLSLIIPCGTAIQNGRTSYLGDTFTRDGHHLNLTYGRYTAACTWFEAISGVDVTGISFTPDGIDERSAKICREAAHQAVLHPYSVSVLR